MTGSSPQTTTTTQQQKSSTQPWLAAQPLLQQILGKYSGFNPDVTTAQQTGLEKLSSEAGSLPQFDTSSPITNLLNSSTDPQVAALKATLAQTQGSLAPIADPNNLDPYKTPGFSDALSALTQNITNAVKGVYAGSGRDPSGAGTFGKSLGIGLMQGEAPIIQSQYNQNVGNLQTAANTLQNAGLSTQGAITGQEQIPLTNAAQAIGLIPAAATGATTPGSAQLGAATAGYQMPFSNLAPILQAALGIGSLGQESQGTGTGTQTSTPASNGLSNIMGGVLGGTGLLSNLGAFGSSGWLTSLLPFAALSDERAKEDVEKVGELDDGQNVYSFKYKGVPGHHIGLMAQEVEEVVPDAVHELPGIGLLAVDYKRATERAAHMRKAA